MYKKKYSKQNPVDGERGRTEKMPTYKLMYFDVRARAEISRYLFALAGVEYEDQRLNKDTWPAVKPETPFGQLPVLSIDGKMFSQSVPIAIYLAKEFGYYGSTPLENLAILEILGMVGDLKETMGKAFFENDNDKKAELMKKCKEEDIPNVLKIFEKLLSKTSSEYFAAGKLTLGDIAVFDVLEMPMKENPKILDATPKLKANYENVRNNPKIKAWIEKRPQTQF